MNTAIKFYDLSELEAIAREILPVDPVYARRAAALMAADPSLTEDDAWYIAQTTPGEPTEEDLAHTRAEDRAVERAAHGRHSIYDR